MVFPERRVENYVLIRNAIKQELRAITLCSFVKDNVSDSSNEKQCPYSYAVPGQHNEFSFCTSPTASSADQWNYQVTDLMFFTMISFFRFSWDEIIIKSVCFREFSALVTTSRYP